MLHLILGRDQRELERPRLRDRIRCWLRGGHELYYNREFGEMWCKGPCGGIWHLDPPVDLR